MQTVTDSTKIIQWLLEDTNPEVKLRTLKEYMGYGDEHIEVVRAKEQLLVSSIFVKAMDNLISQNKWKKYDALIAFAEWGLTRKDIDIDSYVFELIENTGFKMMCGEALLLRNLVKLGYYNEAAVHEEIDNMFWAIKDDGGFGCLSKNKKINDPKKAHKSCARITAGYLLLLAELKLMRIDMPCEKELVKYFTKRNIFYRTDDIQTVMVKVMTETFYPIDAIQIGVQNLIYALSILGQGKTESAAEGWKYMKARQIEDGRYIITKSKTVPAFKPGSKNKPNKWITLYAIMTENIERVLKKL
jgi:hypothetical protein